MLVFCTSFTSIYAQVFQPTSSVETTFPLSVFSPATINYDIVSPYAPNASVQAQDAFSIWPNPSQNDFKLIGATKSQVTLTICDISGRVLFNHTGLCNVIDEQLAKCSRQWQAGTYIAQLHSDSNNLTYKLIKL